MDDRQVKQAMHIFILSQFSYCPLIWKFCDRQINNRINRIHEKSLRLAYDDYESSFQTLLEKDNSTSIHDKNLQLLLTEIYKTLHNLNPSFMKEIFTERNTCYNLRNISYAYDMVPHSWIIECLRLYRVSDNVVNFIERSMTNWKVQLTSCGETLGLVNIRRGIFQGDSLSPLLFVICMIPLTEVLRKVKMGYTLDGVKINHLLFMDDLKLFAKNENEIDSLTSTVNLISQDIGVEFGIKKCGVVTLRRGKLTGSAGIELVNGEKIKEVGEEGYKYLGITELDRIKEGEMEKIFQREFFEKG